MCDLFSFTEEYSVNVERPCPMETVTFTCIAAGNLLRWEVSDSDDTIEILSTSDLNVPIGVSGYTVTLIAFNDTTLTSTLSRTAESVITVSCVGLMPVGTIGSITIRLVGELPFIYKVSLLSHVNYRSTGTTLHHKTLHFKQLGR